MNGIIRQISRKFIFPAALKSGLDKLILSGRKKNCCIINFHGVREGNAQQLNNRHLPVSEFEKIVKYLKQNFEVVPLEEIFGLHRDKRKPQRPTIALTFDDGYLNNFEVALPVLRKYNVPATFFIISKSLVEENYLAWPDKIDLVKKHCLGELKIQGNTFSFPAFKSDEGIPLANFLKKQGELTEELANELLNQFPAAKKELVENGELLRLVNKEQLEKYAGEKILSFGSHTHSHFNLEFVSRETAALELSRSKKIIEDSTGRKIQSIAFPDGSYDPELVNMSISAGYTFIVAVDYHYGEQNTNPHLLSRFTISNSTTFESNILRFAKQFDKYGF